MTLCMMIDTVVIGDFHWDALDALKQYMETEWVLDFIKRTPHLDLVVIAGDYFDTKILLNSRSSIYAIRWMGELVKICRQRNTKIRIIRGTTSHDNNQLDAFNSFENENPDQFRIIRTCTAEETFPGFNCLYCPDETIPTKDYMDLYHDRLFAQKYDAMFFHGSFDVVVPNIAIQESESSGINNVIFKYDTFESIARVMIGGHWHDGDHHNHMYYTRSLNRWAFNEEKMKGFIYMTYDTDDKSYNIQRVANVYTDHYITRSLNTMVFKGMDDYHALMEDIDDMLNRDETSNLRIRIKILIEDEKVENDNGINALKHHYMNEKRVKIALKNAMKEKKKKEDRKKNDLIKSEFAFVQDKTKTPSQIIQEFILHQKGRIIPLDVIDDFVNKVLK